MKLQTVCRIVEINLVSLDLYLIYFKSKVSRTVTASNTRIKMKMNIYFSYINLKKIHKL